MNETNLVVHVGYPKAASSFLQENLFKRHPSLNYINVRNPNLVFERIYKDKIGVYQHSACSSTVNNEIIPLLSDELTNIIADERFLSNMVHYKEVAKRIHSLFGNCKILIVVRSQFDIIRSRYDMHPYDYRSTIKTWMPFEEWLLNHLDHYNDSFLSTLEYDKVFKLYSSLFGVDNICVILFEKLIKLEAETINKVSDLLNLDPKSVIHFLSKPVVNKSDTHWLYHFRLKYLPGIKFSKYISIKFIHRFMRLTRRDVGTNIKPQIKQTIFDCYSKSNNTLSKLLNLDLSTVGYP